MRQPVTKLSRAQGFSDKALFQPRAVVLVADPTLADAHLLAANMAAGGFGGLLAVVGMAAPGLRPFARIEEIEEGTDLAVLAVRREAVAPALLALAARGCSVAVVTAEMPPEELAAATRAAGVRALGPRSFGVALPHLGLNASLSHLPVLPGRLALLAQSSAVPRAVLDWAAAEAVGFSHIIGIGDNADLGFAPLLDWLARDPSAGAVLLDLRRIRNRRLFVSAARAASRTRPVVAIRPGGGRDASGAADAVLGAVLARAGVLRVEGLEDLLSAAETLPRVKPAARFGPEAARGDRIAIVGNGEGLALLAVDALIAGGARLAATGGENPLVLPAGAGVRIAEEANRLAAAPSVDCVLLLRAPEPGEGAEEILAALIAQRSAARGKAPVLIGWCGQATAGPQRKTLAEAGLPVFATPEAAVRGALHLARDHRNRAAAAELPSQDVLEITPDRAAVAALFAAVRAEGRLRLTEAEGLSVLAAYGMGCVPGRIAQGPTQAAVAAAGLGFPAVLKILSPDLPRKTEVGGVMLGLADSAAVLRAAKVMLAEVPQARPDARIDGLLVQRMAGPGQELRLHLSEDAMFGPYIGFGRGGTAADFEPDESFDLPPMNRTLALALLDRSRAARLFAGHRDVPPADRGAVADALVRLSQLAVDFPQIATVSINPLRASMTGALALDASILLRPAGERGQLAIPPYPAELARSWTSRDGERLTIRPIRPEDAAAHADAFRRMEAQDVRWRFFSPMKELSAEQIARMTQVDYDREMAFIAVDAKGWTVGTARLIRAGLEAEFAIMIDPSWKGRGLGRELMRRILDWGASVGVTQVVGLVLADNAPMQAFVRALGFTLRRLPGEEDMVEAVMALEPPAEAAPTAG